MIRQFKPGQKWNAMRKVILTPFAVLALALACHAVSVRAAAGGKDKKLAAKASAAEIEKLVKDLGSDVYRTRAEAAKSLIGTPGVLAFLRRALAAPNVQIEKRRRVEALIDQISQRQFRKLLREAVGREKGVPLDLLVDIITEWKDKMDNQDWRVVFDGIASVQTKVLNASRFKPRDLPDPTGEFINHPITSAEYLQRGIRGTVNRLKIVGEKTAARHIVSYCSVVQRKTIEFDNCGNGLFLANGNIAIRSCGSAFVYCGADFTCEGTFNCLVIARGKVKGSRIEDCIVLDESVAASRKYLFSTKMLGLTLSRRGRAFCVDTVFDGSRAARSGFEPGDLITPNDFAALDVPSLEEVLRRGLAKQTELVFRVERKGATHLRVLSTFDN